MVASINNKGIVIGDNNDVVEVYIKDINDETKKISLGYKKAEDNPWEIMRRDYPVGTVCKAKVVGMTTFGAFANDIMGQAFVIMSISVAAAEVAVGIAILLNAYKMRKTTELDDEKLTSLRW